MSGGQTPWSGFDKLLKYINNFIQGTACGYHMPYVVAYVAAVVDVGSRTGAMGRHHPFARAIKQCSLIVELRVGRAEGSSFSRQRGCRRPARQSNAAS
jgi:hypothetical protein